MAFIIFFILILISLGFILAYIVHNHYLVECFKKNNVIVYGKKGSGKDLIFQYVINKRKRPYLSNISYGNKYKHIEIKELELNPNTYDNFIKGNISKIDKNLLFENHDIYISDGGIYLPSQYDNKLYKTYPSLPITYALSRHLYNNNIHCNVQNIGRLWKALREQADTYILAKNTIKLCGLFIVRYNIYDKYNTAVNELEPLKVRKGIIARKDYTDTRDKEYKAVNGSIKKGYFIITKKSLKYDTRIFEKYVFKDLKPNVESREVSNIKKTFKGRFKTLSLWVHRLVEKLTKKVK